MTADLISDVTGSSRGVGKGIAIALGQTDATVYVTAEAPNGTESPVGGTVAKTAAAVTEAGGRGIAVAVDHADDAAVAAPFAEIVNEHARLDILVNNAAKLVGTTAPGSFWQKPLKGADLLLVA
jgi:NAD(P)-dependent dehydrogenase (short-subunit alcohol dehydrogenase family)